MGIDTSKVTENLSQIETDTNERLKQAEDIIQGTERDVLKTVDNTIQGAEVVIRDTAKNVVGLADNQFDHFFQLLSDTRSDIANTVQIATIIGAAGIAAFIVLYGDKIFREGFNIGEFAIL